MFFGFFVGRDDFSGLLRLLKVFYVLFFRVFGLIIVIRVINLLFGIFFDCLELLILGNDSGVFEC